MDEHPLLRAVAGWPGRCPAQLAFEALGFSIHRAWQEEIGEFCGEKHSELLNRYWDEVAIETMQSLGQGNSDQRAFVIEPQYRSVFLDELFAARPPIELPYRNPPLLRCLLDHTKKVSEDREFRESRITLYSGLQKAEGARLGLDVERRLIKKTDVVPFIDQFCGALGFEARSRNRWRKKVSGGLVFEVGVWLGGNVFRMWSPLKFRIFHVDEPKYAFDTEGTPVLDRLVPGAGMYGRWGSDLDYVLGVRALIELFNAIAGTLVDA
ncbi:MULTISPECIES: hypothetical protein [unclassified Bradyrhizobium]|uniref:hypothetical protein n=1 Tax=unclassified Bradyrhizobium TaxID=2631580 RepID=UPI00048D88FF|nr:MULTISPECIES: hypothetical protein [unclassified Bradyrhizobium]QIG94586.1 hypothetical protein G6P99_20620 [Bradyrhizobium sp. 6(2017)]